MTAAPHTHARQMSPRRRWCFRLLAVLLGLLVLPLLELVCAAFGWGDVDLRNDPFVGFSGSTPLFEQTSDGRWWHTSPARRKFFAEEQFAANKDDNEFRIFVLGGSTVQGRPWSIPTSLTTFLEQALTEAAPDRKWEVVNCGGISYASYRLVPILIECLQYEPDLVIVCTGHNEFLEDVTYADQKTPGTMLPALVTAGQRLRTVRALQEIFHTESQPQSGLRPVLPGEVDALLDHQGGLEAFHRDDEHANMVARHFRSNLERMVAICRERQLPILLLQPPSNLADCPPFKSELSVTGPDEVQQIRQLISEASHQQGLDPKQSVRLLEQAATLDPRFAFAWYQLGHAYLAVGHSEAALNAFVRARDEDLCPLRMTTSLEQGIQHVAAEQNVPFVNLHAFLEPRCRHRLVGDQVLSDHIHPSFRSHQEIGMLLAEWMMEQHLIQRPPDVDGWRAACQVHFATHLSSLENMYFLRGQRALDDLRGWAAGRAEGPPLIKQSEESSSQDSANPPSRAPASGITE